MVPKQSFLIEIQLGAQICYKAHLGSFGGLKNPYDSSICIEKKKFAKIFQENQLFCAFFSSSFPGCVLHTSSFCITLIFCKLENNALCTSLLLVHDSIVCLTSNDSSYLEIMMIRLSYDNFLLAPFANGCGFFL